jgi:hypothetical protein
VVDLDLQIAGIARCRNDDQRIQPALDERAHDPALSFRNPSSLAAVSTRAAVSGDTPYSPFTAREAVFRLTRAQAATSARVGRPGRLIGSTPLP